MIKITDYYTDKELIKKFELTIEEIAQSVKLEHLIDYVQDKQTPNVIDDRTAAIWLLPIKSDKYTLNRLNADYPIHVLMYLIRRMIEHSGRLPDFYSKHLYQLVFNLTPNYLRYDEIAIWPGIYFVLHKLKRRFEDAMLMNANSVIKQTKESIN